MKLEGLNHLHKTQQDEEARHAIAEETARYAILSLDASGHVTGCDEGVEHITGYAPQELLGQYISIFFTPEDRERRAPELEMERAVKYGRDEEELWQVRKDGTRFFAGCIIVPLRDESGNLKGFSKVVRDITLRKKTEEALRISEARFRTVIEQSPISIQILSPEGRTLRVNRAWEELWGVKLEDVADYNMLEDEQLVKKGVMPFIKQGFSGEATRIPPILYDPNETLPNRTSHSEPQRWVGAFIYPVKDDDGRVREVVLMHEDITQRKQTEDERDESLRAEQEAHAQLRESEKLFRKLTENIQEIFWLINPESHDIAYISPAYERIWGRTRESLYRQSFSFLDAIHPQDRERVIAAQPQQILGTYSEEYRVVRPDGTERWIWSRAFPIRNEAGEVELIAGLAQDITERKLTEVELREQRDIIETVNRIGQILSAELDQHKLVQAVTDAATELTGASFGSFFYNVLDEHGASYMLYTLSGVPREAFGHLPMPRATDIFGPTFRSEGVMRLDDVKLDPRYGKSSPYYGMPPGHLPVTSYLAVPVISRTGEVLGGLFFGHPEAGIFTEHDEQVVVGLASQTAIAIDNARLFDTARKARAEAEAAERRAAYLAEASEVMSSSLDYDTTLKNLAQLSVPHIADWCAVDLLEDDRTIRRVAVAHVDPAKIEWAHELQSRYPPHYDDPRGVANVLRTGQSEIYPEITDELLVASAIDEEQLRIMRELGLKSAIIVPLGARGRMLGAITLINAESNRFYGEAELSLAEDLARRAAMAVDNARLYREAEIINRAKDEFLATLSHELRTPLTAVLGWAHLMRTGKVDQTTTSRALETIERNARSQAQLIDDLLDVSRIITGKLRLEVRPVELVPVIEAAIEAVRPAMEAKGIRLVKLLDTQAGPVSGDPDRLQQVIWNLLSNAIKFTPKEGRVEVRLERIDSHVEVNISDTGAGIVPEFLPHVFDRFRQADSTTTRAHGGLGLGLSIVRHLVELHGGTVQADSQGVGHGATFTVKLPIRVTRDERHPQDNLQERAGEAAWKRDLLECPPQLNNLHILIVDDEPDTLELLTMILEQCGAEVTTAASVAEALVSLEQLKPDVLISDIGMPLEDGYALIRKLRAREAERGQHRIPAVALTAYARDEDRVRALLSGFQLHMAKPISPAELLAVVASLAGRTGES